MSKRPIGSGFAIGFLIAGGAVGLIELILSTAFDWSRYSSVLMLFIALIAGVAGGMAAIGWVQSWRDAVRSIGSPRANPAFLRRTRWPISLEAADDRVRLLTEQRDNALAGQTFVQQRLEAIVSGLRDGVIVVSPDLSIVSINEAACRVLDVTQRHAVGQPLVEIARDYDLVRIAQETVDSGHEQATPVDYRRLGRQLDVRVLPIEQAGRRLAVLVVQDVTQLRALERMRTDFVSNVSHELRTPLAAIRALVETLNDGAIDDETVARDFLERVLGEVDRLNELIEDLLDLGRLESGRLPLRRSEIAPAELIRRSVARVAHKAEDAGVEIRVFTADELPILNVDASRLVQVLINLLDNAIKFSPRGGSVEVCAGEADGTVSIAVADHGAGIAPEDLSRIFERFYKSDRSRHSGGTGLGLAIAKHIMSAHGGQLTATSEVGKGSVFTVSLPVTE
jgi:two-component system, OmpR family, phosphate regulon sensor histidine kinase PhoR